MKGRFWILAVPALLLPVVVMNVVMLIKSSGSGAVAIEPDYYEKAIRWDERVQEEAASRALGWRLDLALAGRGEGLRLEAALRDSSDRPVLGAGLQVEAFHNALSNQRQTLDFAPRDSGYSLAFPAKRPGLWEFRLRASRGEELFTEIRRIEIPADRVGSN